MFWFLPHECGVPGATQGRAQQMKRNNRGIRGNENKFLTDYDDDDEDEDGLKQRFF